LLAHARRLAASIAAKSPLAVATSKLALNHARDHGTADALHQMTLLQSAAFDIGENGRAIAARKAKAPGEVDPPGGPRLLDGRAATVARTPLRAGFRGPGRLPPAVRCRNIDVSPTTSPLGRRSR